MVKTQEVIFIAILIIFSNGALFISFNPTPDEEIYTVSSVMSQINQEGYGNRGVASTAVLEHKQITPKRIAQKLPKILDKLVRENENFQEDSTWKFYIDGCLQRDEEFCIQLVEKWSNFVKSDFVTELINPLFQEITVHLILFVCHLEDQQYFQTFENGVSKCSQYRFLAKAMAVEGVLAKQFSYYCQKNSDQACIEQLYYVHKIGEAPQASEQTLYHLCELKFLGACQLWLEYYSKNRHHAQRESVQMWACILGDYNSCEQLMHEGSMLYSERATHYLVQSCLGEKKNCELLASQTDLRRIKSYRLSILQELCHQGYARHCHSLVIAEVKKYGILVAKVHLKARCESYFLKVQPDCSLSQSLECKNFQRLCEEYEISSVQFSHQ